MNKSILLIIFLFFFSTYFVNAQNEAVADSLFKIAQKAKKQKDLASWLENTRGGIGEQCGYDDSCRVKNYQKVLNELWQEPKTKEENYQLSRVYISYAYSMNYIGQYRKTKEIYNETTYTYY